MTAPVNTTFTTGTTITSNWLNGVNDAINDSTQDITGAVPRTLPAKLAETVSVKDFGAVGDGITDDTTAINAAIDYVNTTDQTLYFPVGTGNYKITSALHTVSTRGGVEMESVAYSSAGKGAILVTGTGYTGVTVTGAPSFQISVVGTGQAANGLLVQNPAMGNFEVIRVANFDGYGVKINKCWDCVFSTISVELCGNATEYAFSMNDDGDTCNMSHIMRLQVETSNTKAISISPNTLSCVIDNIHSEGASGVFGTITWALGGNRCTYNTARLAAAVAANANITISAANTTFVSLVTEGAIPVDVEGYDTQSVNFIGAEIQGAYKEITNQTGAITFVGGSIASLTGQQINTRYIGSKVTNTFIGTKSDKYTFSFGNGLVYSETLNFTGNGMLTLAKPVTGCLLYVRESISGVNATFLLDGAGAATKIAGDASWTLGVAGPLSTQIVGTVLQIYNTTGSARSVTATLIGV